MNKKYLESIIFWYILLLVIYTPLYFIFLDKSRVETFGGHVTGLIGLFIPLAFPSLVWAFVTLPFSLLSVFTFGVMIKAADRLISSKNTTTKNKIISIFVALFILTFIIDLVRFMPFQSLEIFLKGKMCFGSC